MAQIIIIMGVSSLKFWMRGGESVLYWHLYWNSFRSGMLSSLSFMLPLSKFKKHRMFLYDFMMSIFADFSRKGRTWSHLSSLSSLPVNPLNRNPADLSSPSSAPLQKIIKRYACYSKRNTFHNPLSTIIKYSICGSFSGKGYICKPKNFLTENLIWTKYFSGCFIAIKIH